MAGSTIKFTSRQDETLLPVLVVQLSVLICLGYLLAA